MGKGIALITVLLLIAQARGLDYSMKSRGLTGHPCLIERLILKYVLRNPFVRIDVFASLKIIFIQETNFSSKLNLL